MPPCTGSGPSDGEDAREWLDAARRGDFEAAWHASDRIRARSGPPDFTRPRHLQQIWTGADLRGQRVLVRCYHGLGDTIQFIRYARLVRALAREVIVWAPARLLPLLQTAAGIDRLLPLHDGSPDVEYDVDVEVMELPYVFRTVIESIPSRVPYLTATPRPLHGSRPRVGIVWRGGGWNEARAIPFAQVRDLLDGADLSWFRLQYPCADDEQHARLRPLDCASIERTAEYIGGLDLVISVDTMAAHLAGALGVRVWTLLAADADWRWMTARDDSPWYPTMRLFRQRREGDWGGVIDEVTRRLAETL